MRTTRGASLAWWFAFACGCRAVDPSLAIGTEDDPRTLAAPQRVTFKVVEAETRQPRGHASILFEGPYKDAQQAAALVPRASLVERTGLDTDMTGVRDTLLPPGTYTAMVLHGCWPPVTFEVGGRSRTIELPVTGMVTWKGRLIDAHGEPVAGFLLTLAATPDDGCSQSVFTESNGEFVAVGTRMPRVFAQNDTVTIKELTSRREGDEGTLHLRVNGAPAFELLLRDARGAAVENAQIAILPADLAAPVEWAEAGPGGRVVLYGSHLRQRPHGVLVTAELPDASRSEFIELPPAGPSTLPIQVGEEPGASINGKVLAPDGGPVAGADISVRLRGPIPPVDGRYLRPDLTGRDVVVTRTGKDGSFHFGGLRGNCDYIVFLDAPKGFASPREDPVVRSGSPPLVMTLERPFQVTGKVVHRNGEPVRRFFVDGIERSGPEGRFTARPSLPDRIAVSAEGLIRRWIRVDRTAGPDLGTIVLTPVSTLHGRIVDEAGRPIDGAQVVLPPLEGSVRTNPDGAFEVRMTEEGPVEYQVSTRDGRGIVASASGTPGEVNIVLPEAGTVEGTLTGQDTVVQAICQRRLGFATESHRGTFSLALPAGSCWLTADGQDPREIEVIGANPTRVTLQPAQGSARLFLLHPRPSHYVHAYVQPGDVSVEELVDWRWGLYRRDDTDHAPNDFRIVSYPTETIFSGLSPGRYTAFVIDDRIERRVIDVKPGFNFVDMNWSAKAPSEVRGAEGALEPTGD